MSAYNMRFFGDKMGYSPILKRKRRIISDELYRAFGLDTITSYIRKEFLMSQEYENLSQEIDAYIRWHYRPEGTKIKDLIEGIGGRTFGVGMDAHTGTAKWALSFLLDKLELTFYEKLMKLLARKTQ